MEKAPGSLRTRLAWFIALWAAGVAVVGAIAWLLRLWVG
ncbi:MAG: DUF2474 domain-containing protein [Allosphingosinicella sp.]